VEPPLQVEGLPFGDLMRHKSGSRSFYLSLKHLVIEYR
jgi:hypothetical protein